MFDTVRNNQRVVQFVLALVILPFAFWGVDSYVRDSGSSDEVAKVGNSKITRQEFQNAMRDQQDRLRGALGAAFKPEMLNTPEAKQAVLEGLVSQRVLALQVQASRLAVSDEQLREVISNIPALQENGQFSMERYQRAVQSQGMSQAGFEARLRGELAMQQIPLAVGQSAFVSKTETELWLASQLEQRQVAEQLFKAESFVGQVKPTATAVQQYYDSHRQDFEMPAQAMVEYLVLSQDDLAANITVAEADVRAWYDKHADRYKAAAERRASHILIPVAEDAPEAAQKAARSKAEDILAQVRKNPADFAKLAKAHSSDPGSAEKGGDLGFFPRGAMVKSFDDAVFALKEGQIADLVRSEFGFHIIRVTGIKGAQSKSYAEMQAQIQRDLKSQAATRQYAEAADAFANIVYEQADSLKPAADKFKLTVRKAPGWIARGQSLPSPLHHPKLLEMLFAEDSVKNKRNTEAVEVAPNTLVSARVLDYRPASLRPLAEVQAEITKKLALEEAAKLTEKAGQEALAAAQKGEGQSAWSGNRAISRVAAGLPGDAVKAIFSADTSKLPAYAASRLPGGSYAVYKISAVEAKKPDMNDSNIKQFAQRYSQLRAQDQMGAYFAALKQRYPVSISKSVLETKE